MTLCTFVLAMLPLSVSGKAKEDLLQNQRARRAATELFRAGSPDAAVSYLKQNLRPETGPGGETTGLVQNLIEIAVSFFNRRELNLARLSAGQALLSAESIIKGQSQASALRRADLYGSLGVLHETVIFDLKSAQAFYDAAGALNPADELNQRRKKAVSEKDKLRAGGGK
jgi:hypothetical protein